MVKRLKLASFVIFIIMLPFQTLAQEEEHSHETDEEHADVTQTIVPNENEVPGTSDSVFRSFQNFPNLHPMVVHFPIVLLLFAFITQLIGLFTLRNTFSRITLFLLFGGLVGAVLVSQVFRAHAAEVPEKVHRIFETHEYYGKVTTWLAGIALVLKIVSHFLLKRKTWAEIIFFLAVAGSAITVSLAGHLGSQMVYIENVGPQGKHLEEHEHEE